MYTINQSLIRHGKILTDENLQFAFTLLFIPCSLSQQKFPSAQVSCHYFVFYVAPLSMMYCPLSKAEVLNIM